MPVAPVGSASLATPDAFWTQVLVDMGAPVTQSNIDALRAWSGREGTKATWNPLAVSSASGQALGPKVPDTGSAVSFATPSGGAQATADYIRNGRYPSIVAAFMTGSAFEALVSGGKGPIGSQLRTWSDGGYNNVDVGANLYVSPSLGGLKTQGHGATPGQPALESAAQASSTTSTGGPCQTLAQSIANAGPVPIEAQIAGFFGWITQGCVEKRLVIQGVSALLILYGLKFMGHSEPLKIVTAPVKMAGEAAAFA
jgi:hypothetical protein